MVWAALVWAGLVWAGGLVLAGLVWVGLGWFGWAWSGLVALSWAGLGGIDCDTPKKYSRAGRIFTHASASAFDCEIAHESSDGG